MSNAFVEYLNNLHNYNAQNKNAYAEKSVESSYFPKVAVKMGLCDYITNIIKTGEPQIIILTGHAGDGKTSIMYQVIDEIGGKFDSSLLINDINLPDGKICRCIKDFSEFSDDKKVDILKECLLYPNDNNFVFMVANTGPLINTYGKMFDDEETSNFYKRKLIDAMDKNYGKVFEDLPHKINVINVAQIDNTYFAEEFLKKVVSNDLWSPCNECSKKNFCFVLRNINLIKENFNTTVDFINKHYIWLTEHGDRLTIRSMTEQLAFMITGGVACNNIKEIPFEKKVYSNLFFGYDGLKFDKNANNILAISVANKYKYDTEKLRIDEFLIMNKSYDKLFSKQVSDLLTVVDSNNGQKIGYDEFLRRMYFFMNINTDDNSKHDFYSDVFSPVFDDYLLWRNGKKSPSKSDTYVIVDALSMIYIGAILNESDLPVTLSREAGNTQNVQLIIGDINKKKISLKPVLTNDSTYNLNKKRYVLKMIIDKTELKTFISLPLLNYFEELRNGIINTNIDPQLSHGIESLKAEISKIVSNDQSETIEMVILRNSRNLSFEFEVENDIIKEV